MAKKKRKNSIPVFILLVLLLPAFSMVVPTVIFLFFALLPTFVAMIVEDARQGYKWVCILGLNITGSLPFLFDLWEGVNDIEAVFDLLVRVKTIIVIYGCAALGWLLYLLFPPIISSIINHTDRGRVVKLKEEQQKLIAKWGNEVSSPN